MNPERNEVTDEKCDACHKVDCADKHLCDVVMPTRLCPPGRNGDLARDQQGIDEVDLKARLVQRYHAAVGSIGHGYSVSKDRRDAFRSLIKDCNLTFLEASTAVDISVQDGVALITKAVANDVLAAEHDLRNGVSATIREVAKNCGVTESVVRTVSEVTGLVPEGTARTRSGGSTRWTKEQINEAHDLRDQGFTYAAIGHWLSVDVIDNVEANNLGTGIIRRNARRP